MYTPEPEDTGDGDKPFSSEFDLLVVTDSHWTDFGARLGDPFTYVTNAPTLDDTGVGNRLLSIRLEDPNHTGLSLVRDSVKSSPMICTHRTRIILEMETDRSHPISIARV